METPDESQASAAGVGDSNSVDAGSAAESNLANDDAEISVQTPFSVVGARVVHAAEDTIAVELEGEGLSDSTYTLIVTLGSEAVTLEGTGSTLALPADVAERYATVGTASIQVVSGEYSSAAFDVSTIE